MVKTAVWNLRLEILNSCNMLEQLQVLSYKLHAWKPIQGHEKKVAQIAPYTVQKLFRVYISSAENCARPQKLSHARVTIDLFSTFLTHWNVRTQISNGCFYHFGLTDKYPPQKRSHLSVSILLLGIPMNSFWFETGTGKEHASYCWYRKVSTTNKETLLLHTFYSKVCMCNDYSPAIEWLKA